MSQAPAVKGSADVFMMAPEGPQVEPSPRWVRVKAGEVVIAGSRRTLLLRQYGPGRLPTYCFPEEDVRMDLLERTAPEAATGGGTTYYDVRAGGQVAERAAWMFMDPPPEAAALKGYLTFMWGKGLQWFEEEEEVFMHARDPHKRVDVMRSSRHVRVVIDGATVAETRRPTLLFETSAPVRYYIPSEDVRLDLFQPSNATTRCPYKGIASYWSAQVGDRVHRNIVWSYLDPIPENPKIKGLLCFFNERVDLYVDDELQTRPITPWSRSEAG